MAKALVVKALRVMRSRMAIYKSMHGVVGSEVLAVSEMLFYLNAVFLVLQNCSQGGDKNHVHVKMYQDSESLCNFRAIYFSNGFAASNVDLPSQLP